MFWIQRREGAYRERMRQAIDAQQVIPYGYLDYDLGESWLGDPWADLSRIFVGGDLTAMRRVDLEPDIPYELITMLRALIFHNDPRNDGAVRVLSQIGGLDQHVVLDGILHSFAPWHYAVQRQCIDLLKWEDGRFSPNGFGPAGQPLPVYQPLAAFRDDRLKGLEAIDWSGMVREHALAIAELSDAEDLVVIYRPVNRDCTPLIASHCATKNMLIKGKSSDWGPQRGYIPREQRFSKFWTQYQGHRATFDKKVHEYNEITEQMLAHTVYPPDDDPEAARWTGRKVAVARPLIVSAGGADYELWHDPENPDCEAAIYLRPVGGQAYFDWRSGAGDGSDPKFDPAVAPSPKRPAPAPEVVQRLQPLEVLADGLADGDPKPYLTADYDLLAVAPRNSSDFFGEPAELKRLKQGKPHATRGYITREQRELVKQINQTVRQKANYQGGNVSHHGPENQYPDSPYVDYPLLVFDPGSPDRGDAEVFVVRQGPPGFRDLHLKRYFEEKIREHFNLYPNREGRGWQWESWRAFSMERAATILATRRVCRRTSRNRRAPRPANGRTAPGAAAGMSSCQQASREGRMRPCLGGGAETGHAGAARSRPFCVMPINPGWPMSTEPLIAVFVDFENLAIGVRDMKSGDFQIQLVLKRLLEKGRIVFKRAYCDWSNYPDAVREFHAQGIELIDIPQSKMSGKNSADIRMVVDALDLCYSKQHIDIFALISGDSDFSPLVSKLKENNKRVIGCGVKSSTSDLLIANCDEFIYYDDLIRDGDRRARRTPEERQGQGHQDKKQEAIDRAAGSPAVDRAGLRSAVGLDAQAGHPPRLSRASTKATTATAASPTCCEDLQDQGLIELEYDDSRGNYKVRRVEG